MSAQNHVEGKWEQLWLPLWPLTSDDLVQGIYRMSRDIAATLGVTPGLVSIRLREAREAGVNLSKQE